MENHKPEYINSSMLAKHADVYHDTIHRLLLKKIIVEDATASLGEKNVQYLFLKSRLEELSQTIKGKGRYKKSPVFYS